MRQETNGTTEKKKKKVGCLGLYKKNSVREPCNVVQLEFFIWLGHGVFLHGSRTGFF